MTATNVNSVLGDCVKGVQFVFCDMQEYFVLSAKENKIYNTQWEINKIISVT